MGGKRARKRCAAPLRHHECMAGYGDQAEDEYYFEEPAGSSEQDLVYALDAWVRHTVNQALAQAIKPIKHHLLGFAEQQVLVAP
ncbi:hypothetical protein NDU88_000917 [Pleurodeles waltl]|uniref:Uncharacterized protein n=1 Tax=Pleurodeles waltl TaxID=8319 RepID=A0AAV7USR3_PLEWA|nr:hypothetical protein NDU88_000917 [Pleurodeles waltl]